MDGSGHRTDGSRLLAYPLARATLSRAARYVEVFRMTSFDLILSFAVSLPVTGPPAFIARMGKDSPEINRSVNAFVTDAGQRQFPVEVASYPDGVHGFDIVMDIDQSRAVI